MESKKHHQKPGVSVQRADWWQVAAGGWVQGSNLNKMKKSRGCGDSSVTVNNAVLCIPRFLRE